MTDRPEEQQQPYDNLFKALFEGQEWQIIPLLCEGAQYIETLDVEVHRTTLRVDRVYKALYQGMLCIVHIEFETSADKHMDKRMLDYFGYLYHKYHLPIIPIILYPFKVKMVASPLKVVLAEKVMLEFHFQTVPLWKLDAERFVRERIFTFYPLLPAMQRANSVLLNKAIDELISYYQDNEKRLTQELIWMGIILRRSDILPVTDKTMIEERLQMYNDLFEQDPKIQQIRAESEARGEAKGEAKGLQIAVVTVVKGRFPPLAELAQRQVPQVQQHDRLNTLLQAIIAAPDEKTARFLLEVAA